MTTTGISRRGFIGGSAGAGVVLVIGARASAQTGGGPYGALASAPDANGLLLPDGFTSRVIARAGENVPGTPYEWPAFPDGAATFADDDGGWYHVVNSEIPVQGDGGASVLHFDAAGEVVDAYRVLGGTTQNCAGGPTPWGTWLSCEEATGGQVWECDPTIPNGGVVLPAMGSFRHEAAAVDPDGERVYLTEDEPEGAFYRFTPDAYPDLSSGLLEVASVTDGEVSWYEVSDPSGADGETRTQVPEVTHFNGGEGCWYADGTVYFTTKGTNEVWALDAAADTLEVIYDGEGLLTGVDNITVETGSGDLYVAEDGGDMQLVVITADGDVVPVAQIVAEPLPPGGGVPSEISGPVFSPDGTRLYFSSQRGGNPQTGITYEVTGPFRGIEQEPPPTTTTVAAANGSDVASPANDDSDDDSSPALPIGIAVGAAAVVAAGAVALRRRRDA